MRETIMAREGYVLTDGEIYGAIIYLAEGADASEFYEITAAEYEEIMLRLKEEALGELLYSTT